MAVTSVDDVVRVPADVLAKRIEAVAEHVDKAQVRVLLRNLAMTLRNNPREYNVSTALQQPTDYIRWGFDRGFYEDSIRMRDLVKTEIGAPQQYAGHHQ